MHIKGQKTGGRDFTPGDPRAGRPGLPPEIRELMKARRAEISEDLANITKLTVRQLEELIAKPRTQAIQAAIAAVLVKAITTGDAKSLDTVLDRILGKIKEHRLG